MGKLRRLLKEVAGTLGGFAYCMAWVMMLLAMSRREEPAIFLTGLALCVTSTVMIARGLGADGQA